LSPLTYQSLDDPATLGAGAIAHQSHTQLPIDDSVHNLTIRVLRDEHIEVVLVTEPSAIEVLLHGKAGAEQTDLLNSGLPDLLCRGIGDV